MFIDDKKIIGLKIKHYRKLRNFTQAEIAEKVNISEKHLSKIETGVHYPSLAIFFNICEILEIPLGEFCINIPQEEEKAERVELFKDILALDDAETEFVLDAVKLLLAKYKINHKQK